MRVTTLLQLTVAGLSGLASGFVAVSGVSGDQGSNSSYRININTLESNGGPQWDLYIRAMQRFQDMSSDDQLSYFQIGAIHGMPWAQWDNAGYRRGDRWLGYCPHGELLFAPWHRPYVLLFEQQVVKIAMEIAEEYPQSVREEYQTAAKTLRVPFWDWAADSDVPPCTVPYQLTINVPSGSSTRQANVPNPLAGYKFPQAAVQGRYGSFPGDSQVTRCSGWGESYPQSGNYRLSQRNLRQNTYAAYIYSRSFPEFVQTGNNGVGMEQVHGWIHSDATCGETFFAATTSGFDPLFMMHHSNVDRLWAYWEYMRPDMTHFTNTYYGQSRYDSPSNSIISADTKLTPFRQSDGSFWTTATTSNLEGQGYTYEGLEYWNKTREELQRDAIAVINKAYGSPQSFEKREAGSHATGFLSGKRHSDNGLANKRVATMFTQYFAVVDLDREDVEAPCAVNVYIAGKLAGSIPVMPQPETGNVKGRFIIDDAVEGAFARIGASETDGHVPDIDHMVEVDITRPNGSKIAVYSVESLKLSIEEVFITPAKSITELPEVGEKTSHPIKLMEHI